ncbi:hypothetical protein ACNQFN_17010 [Thauera butanivorans]|uniref:hypothetical protein n=1 Tax=Thauera butanivorans TaxID=86174 RepID=UPI003AB20665
MKPKFIGLAVATALALPFAAGSAHAKATADEIARLGKDLNCIGAEKAGNADGSIPEWSGKWLGVPPHVDFKGTGRHPIDPARPPCRSSSERTMSGLRRGRNNRPIPHPAPGPAAAEPPPGARMESS